jgi:hypothetical protein
MCFEGCFALCERLRRNDPSLTILNLPHQAMGNDGACALAAALADPTNTHLVVGMLDNNHIGPSGCRALCASLTATTPQSSPPLVHLYLSYNRIGDEGAVALAALLSSSVSSSVSSLQVLKIAHNEIGPRGAAVLAQALAHQACRLTTLDASANAWGRTGVTSVLAALADNSALRTLDVRDNQDSPPPDDMDDMAALRQAAIRFLRHNVTLSHLYLGDESSPDDEKTAARRGVEKGNAVTSERATLAFYLAWNRAGRQSLACTTNGQVVPMAHLLANAAAAADKSVLFASLRTRPDVVGVRKR